MTAEEDEKKMLQGEFHPRGCDSQCMRLLHIPLLSNPASGQQDPTSCPTCSMAFPREMLPNKPQNDNAASPFLSFGAHHMGPVRDEERGVKGSMIRPELGLLHSPGSRGSRTASDG